jgi:hypothetical protein
VYVYQYHQYFICLAGVTVTDQKAIKTNEKMENEIRTFVWRSYPPESAHGADFNTVVTTRPYTRRL